jgi:S-layer family protein
MKLFTARAAVVAGVALALAGTAGAQDLFRGPSTAEPLTPGNENWGTSTNIIQTYEASDFELFAGTYGGIDPGTAARFCGGGPCAWFSGIRVPAGASITAIELDACDTDATGEVSVSIFRNVKAGGASIDLNGGLAGTGVAAVPGCSTFVRTLTAPETVNNLANNYFLDVNSGAANTTRFKAVRVIYRLQLSPAPATATFTDVPTTHFAFRFVEALAASGITGGCGAGTYCPDAPLTRAQMAIFLATALGLHFPN